MYIKKTWRAGRTVEVKKTQSFRYGKRVPRGNNLRQTSDAQSAVNRRNAVAELRRLLNANFSPGDWHCVFTYPQATPPNKEQARQDLDRFLRKLRKVYRDRGAELKYVAVTEYRHSRIHHHIVLPDLPGGMKPVKATWKQLVAETYYTPEERERGEPLHLRFPWSELDGSGQYGALAEYLIKETDDTRRKPDGRVGRRYRASRNLHHPQPVVEEVSAKEWRREPPKRKGFYIDKNGSWEGVSEENGLCIQETIYVALQPRKGVRKNE